VQLHKFTRLILCINLANFTVERTKTFRKGLKSISNPNYKKFGFSQKIIEGGPISPVPIMKLNSQQTERGEDMKLIKEDEFFNFVSSADYQI
jgi:hypothetical protein